jgi:uncharacterized membrane protein
VSTNNARTAGRGATPRGGGQIATSAVPDTSAAGPVSKFSRNLRIAMIVLTVLGVALATYLTIVHYAGLKPACTAGQSCIKVQTSYWSKLDGVPVALLGLIGYIGILISLVLPDREETRAATLFLTLIGVGFSGYLTYRELFSIHAVCEECATSAVFLALLFIAAVTRWILSPMPELDPEVEVRPPRARSKAPARNGNRR